MSDLRNQLAAALGVTAPEPVVETPSKKPTGPLADFAWVNDPWVKRLRQLLGTVPGSPRLAPKPKLGQARQATDQLLSMLKRGGRKHDMRELKGLRDAFMAKREKAAWTEIKRQFSALSLSDKAYRGLKQQKGLDPVAVLRKLNKADPKELKGMGAARLRERLIG